jgi:integrase
MPTYQERDGRIRAIIRLKGHPTVSKTFASKTRAKQWATTTEAAMIQGDYTNPTKLTFRDVAQRYLEEEECDRWVSNRLKSLLRDEKWVDWSLTDCQDAMAAWIDKRRREVKPNTVRREAAIVSSLMTHAMKRWRIKLGSNPMRGVELPPKDKPRNRRVKPSEIDALWDRFGHTATTLRSYIPWMFEFACETGMRLGEITAIEWEHINTEERWVLVAKSKNGDSRHALLTVRALQLLEKLPRRADRVFPVNKDSFGTEFREATKALGFADLHFHDSRHEACTRLARFLTVMELARVIGHRDLRSLMVYYNPTAAELAGKLDGAAAPKPLHPQQPTSVSDWVD